VTETFCSETLGNYKRAKTGAALGSAEPGELPTTLSTHGIALLRFVDFLLYYCTEGKKILATLSTILYISSTRLGRKEK